MKNVFIQDESGENGKWFSVPESPEEIRDWWMDHYDPKGTESDYHNKTAKFFKQIMERCDYGDINPVEPDPVDYESAFSVSKRA